MGDIVDESLSTHVQWPLTCNDAIGTFFPLHPPTLHPIPPNQQASDSPLAIAPAQHSNSNALPDGARAGELPAFMRTSASLRKGHGCCRARQACVLSESNELLA